MIIVCDLHRDGTIDAVRAWKREVSDWACKSGNPNMPIVLFANKCDMLDRADPQVTFKMGACMERICREENVVSWHMTSARSGEGVDEGFNTLISEIMKQVFLVYKIFAAVNRSYTVYERKFIVFVRSCTQQGQQYLREVVHLITVL